MGALVSIKEGYNSLVEAISAIYPVNEASNIIKYLFEDLLEIYSTDSSALLSESDLLLLNDARERLLKYEPIQYITGRAAFMGLELAVDKHVLIPRPETEELAYLIEKDNTKSKELKILDIGTGSGCIAIHLAKCSELWNVTGWDISEKAIEVATDNAGVLDIDVDFVVQDVLDIESINQSLKYDIIVSNPPYIGWDEMHDIDDHVLRYEPKEALFAGEDPLLFYKAIAELGTKILSGNGKLYFELNPLYAHDIADIVTAAGYQDIEIHKDLQGKKRMLKAVKSA